MAARSPPSSSSAGRSRTGDKSVGSFTIENEIGKGSFATVYRGRHNVSSCWSSTSLGLANLPLLLKLFVYFLGCIDIDSLSAVHGSSCSYQISQPCQTQQETQGQPLLRDRDPERPAPSPYRRSDRLPRIHDAYKPGDGIL